MKVRFGSKSDLTSRRSASRCIPNTGHCQTARPRRFRAISGHRLSATARSSSASSIFQPGGNRLIKVVRHFVLNEMANSRHDFDREIVGIFNP